MIGPPTEPPVVVDRRAPPLRRDAEALLRDQVVQGGMVPRLIAALRAVREGVRSVHIINGGVPSALLLEVLTAEGVGTALRSDAAEKFFGDSRAYLLAK